jgi:hypothetical protein
MKNSHMRMAGLFFLLACAWPAVGQQQPTARPQPRVIEFGGDMAHFLAQIGSSYGVTIGLEVDPAQPHTYISVSLRNPTIDDVMNAVVQSAKRYRWERSKNSIDVRPLSGSHPLLDTMIGKVIIDEGSRARAIDQLLDTPEVQGRMRALDLARSDLVKVADETHPGKSSRVLENVSLREALHQISGDDTKQFWIFRIDGKRLVHVSPAP